MNSWQASGRSARCNLAWLSIAFEETPQTDTSNRHLEPTWAAGRFVWSRADIEGRVCTSALAAAGTIRQARYYAWWLIRQSPGYLMTEDDYAKDEFPSPERRAKLRRDTLKLARKFPPGPERNGLRSTAKSLAFFDEVAGPKGNSSKNTGRPGLPGRRDLRQGG